MSQPIEPEGILILDKPSGPTSHDVVDRVRRKFRMKRVGHAGTLDPMATGVLLMLVGRATKVSQYLMGLDKEYEGVARLGETTDSHDAEGEMVTQRPVPELTEAEVRAVMDGFLGDQYQVPPMFSAKKIGGVPLYKLARKGKVVEREPRFIRVSRFDLLSWESPDLGFRLACSKGTYVRTIAHDLGEKIGCGAHLTALRRTAVERFKIADALSWAEFEEGSASEVARHLIPVYQAVPSSLL